MMRRFVICTRHQKFCGHAIKEDEMSLAGSTCGEKENAYRVLVGKPERHHLEDLRLDYRIMCRVMLKCVLINRMAWTGLIWRRIRTGGWLL